MPFEILKHTADLRMKVWAGSLEGLFRDAILGTINVLKGNSKSEITNHKKSPNQSTQQVECSAEYLPRKCSGSKFKRKIQIQAGDKSALLVDFLNEVLTTAHINKEIYTTVNFKKLSETELEAELNGVAVDKFDKDIKAVTYHEADIRRNEKGKWETMMVLDI